jgi:hypothetical protein
VTTDAPEGNGWHAVTEHVGSVPNYQLVVRARCLQAAVVTTVSAQSDVSTETKDVTATCPEGATVVGGGYVIDD